MYIFYFLFFFFLGVEVWVGFFLKSPGQFISCFFRVSNNLSALLLPYFTVMLFFFFFFFFLLLHGTAVGTNWCFWFLFCFVLFFLFQCWSFWEWCPFPCFLIHLGFFPISQHCISFNINISWFLLLWQVNIYYVIFTKHCCMYMILSWLRLGSGGPCLYVFFPPHPT